MNTTYEIDGIRITVCKNLTEARSIRRTRPKSREEAFLFPVTIPAAENQNIGNGLTSVNQLTITGTAMLGYDPATPEAFVSIIYNWTPPETAEGFGYMVDDFTSWTDCTGNEWDTEGTRLKNLL